MSTLKRVLSPFASMFCISKSESRENERRATRNRRLVCESLEQRQLLSAASSDPTDSAFLNISGVFSEAYNYQGKGPAPAAAVGVGTSQVAFKVHQQNPHTKQASQSSIKFVPAPGTFTNDQPMSVGKIQFTNGAGTHRIRRLSLDLNFGANLQPLRITVWIGQNSDNSETVSVDNNGTILSNLPIKTPVGMAKANVYGLFLKNQPSSNGPSQSGGLAVKKEGQTREAELRISFHGLDRDDQIHEATKLGLVDGELSKSGRIAHSHDADMYSFNVVAGQRIAFDLNTPRASNGERLSGQFQVYDVKGKLQKPAHDPDYLRNNVYSFSAAGTYFVVVKSTFNSPYASAGGAHNGMLDGLDDLYRSPSEPGVLGNYTLKLSDPDDQISEGNRTFVVYGMNRSVHGRIATAKDVDMFSFQVSSKGQVVGFDVDLYSTGSLISDLANPDAFKGKARITLFDAKGVPLQMTELFHKSTQRATSIAGPTPFESGRYEPYIEYRFDRPGVYYVAISGEKNGNFNPITGLADTAGGATGRYTLTITSVARNSFDFRPNEHYSVQGELRIPNNPVSNNNYSISTNLIKYGTGAIRTGVETWILIHGRDDSMHSNFSLAGSLQEKLGSQKQILLLDWSMGARDNTSTKPLGGAKWIESVAKWVESVMEVYLNLAPRNIVLVGHSWGSYVAYDTAKRLERSGQDRVKAIVALDPAKMASHYEYEKVNFKQVSSYSWAFYGSGLYGSDTLAKTAHEAFRMVYTGDVGTGGSILDADDRHSLPRQLFLSIVTKNNSSFLYINYFALDRLRNGTSKGLTARSNFDGFHGQFVVKIRQFTGYKTYELQGFQYADMFGATQFIPQSGF